VDALGKQGILNLRTLLGGTRIVAVLVNPVFDYESKLLSAVKRKWKVHLRARASGAGYYFVSQDLQEIGDCG